jgi:hypothetical protein
LARGRRLEKKGEQALSLQPRLLVVD